MTGNAFLPEGARVLLTGPSTSVGRYLVEMLGGCRLTTLGRSGCDICHDLAEGVPSLDGGPFDAVFHLEGTRDPAESMLRNLQATRNLLAALGGREPAAFVFLSATEVYGRSDGEMLDEQTSAWASDEFGRSKILAEDAIREALGEKAAVAMLRAAVIFGPEMSPFSPASKLFDDVVGRRYIHVRGCCGQRSVVTAFDVARAAMAIAGRSGVFNVTDGHPVTMLELAEAMSANTGKTRRMPALPLAWARLAYRLMPGLPAVAASLSPQTIAERSASLTYSQQALHEATGLVMHRVTDVLSRLDPDFPYSDSH